VFVGLFFLFLWFRHPRGGIWGTVADFFVSNSRSQRRGFLLFAFLLFIGLAVLVGICMVL
jgi:hypothetical protein